MKKAVKQQGMQAQKNTLVKISYIILTSSEATFNHMTAQSSKATTYT